MKISRLFNIVYTLMRNENITARELAEKFEVSVRTIHRDIDTLSMAGIPIYASRGRNGGIALLENFVLNKSLLTDKDQLDILSALKSLGSVAPHSEDTANKLSLLFGIKNIDWIETDFTDWNGDQDDKFELVKTAILEQKLISLDRKSRRVGKECRSRWSPYH